MIESDVFVQAMQDMGVNFFTGVPDSILGGIIAELIDRRLYTPAVREDEAVAMAAGAYMGGKIPAVLMQNSGLGTSLNTLISLNVIYRQPCILIVSWRGHDGKDAPEHVDRRGRPWGGQQIEVRDARSPWELTRVEVDEQRSDRYPTIASAIRT